MKSTLMYYDDIFTESDHPSEISSWTWVLYAQELRKHYHGQKITEEMILLCKKFFKGKYITIQNHHKNLLFSFTLRNILTKYEYMNEALFHNLVDDPDVLPSRVAHKNLVGKYKKKDFKNLVYDEKI